MTSEPNGVTVVSGFGETTPLGILDCETALVIVRPQQMESKPGYVTPCILLSH